MVVTIDTMTDIFDEGSRLPASQLIALVDKHVRAPIDKRLTALCSMKCLIPEETACDPSFWTKLDSAKSQMSPLYASIMKAYLAISTIEDSLPAIQEKQNCIQGNIEYMKLNIPKQKRKSLLKMTGNVLKKSEAKNAEKEKAAEEFREKVTEAAMEMQQRFHATLSDWDDITRVQYQSERNGKVIETTVGYMKSFSKMNLVEGEMDGELQMLIEAEYQKILDTIEDKLDLARSLNDSIKTVFNAVQGTSVNAFIMLSQNPTFAEMINDQEAMDSSMSYRIVVPHGAIPGSNVLRVPIVKGAETTFVDVPVPVTAIPGETVMTVHPKNSAPPVNEEEAAAMPEESAGVPQIVSS